MLEAEVYKVGESMVLVRDQGIGDGIVIWFISGLIVWKVGFPDSRICPYNNRHYSKILKELIMNCCRSPAIVCINDNHSIRTSRLPHHVESDQQS